MVPDSFASGGGKSPAVRKVGLEFINDMKHAALQHGAAPARLEILVSAP